MSLAAEYKVERADLLSAGVRLSSAVANILKILSRAVVSFSLTSAGSFFGGWKIGSSALGSKFVNRVCWRFSKRLFFKLCQACSVPIPKEVLVASDKLGQRSTMLFFKTPWIISSSFQRIGEMILPAINNRTAKVL